MKTKPDQIDSSTDVGVAKASKAIKKKKTENKASKGSGVLAAANSEVAVKVKENIKTENEHETDEAQSDNEIAENSNGTALPPKRHKKKDAKRLARLAGGGEVQNVQSTKSPNPKTKHTTKETDEQMDEVNTNEGKKVYKNVGNTIFIGNLPPTTNVHSIHKLFKKYGPILSVRFRTNTGEHVKRKKSNKVVALNCYVRFVKKEHMTKACEMNGHMVGENPIRVTPQDVKPLGSPNSTIFVGNLRAGTTDTELYDFFSTVGEIEYVRQIANRYVAYVCFKKGVSIKKAFKLDQQMLNGRPIRVQQVDPNVSNLRRNKKGHLVKKNRLPNQTASKGAGTKPAKDFHGQVVNESGKKKKKNSFSKTAKANRSIAQKLKAAAI